MTTMLKPCPFCGRDPYRTESVNGTEMLYIGCAICGVTIKAKKIHYPGRTEWSRDIEVVWNSRVSPLMQIVKESMTHWDKLGKPYPEHLQTAVDQLGLGKKG